MNPNSIWDRYSEVYKKYAESGKKTRWGQVLVNEFFPDKGEEVADLFYEEDEAEADYKFWHYVDKFIVPVFP